MLGGINMYHGMMQTVLLTVRPPEQTPPVPSHSPWKKHISGVVAKTRIESLFLLDNALTSCGVELETRTGE